MLYIYICYIYICYIYICYIYICVCVCVISVSLKTLMRMHLSIIAQNGETSLILKTQFSFYINITWSTLS